MGRHSILSDKNVKLNFDFPSLSSVGRQQLGAATIACHQQLGPATKGCPRLHNYLQDNAKKNHSQCQQIFADNNVRIPATMRILFVLLSLIGIGFGLEIAAFNMRVFGQAKMKKPRVVNILADIIRRYDIILVQEIRDKSGTAIQQLLEEVNERGKPYYEMKISGRLGRTSSKEQYAYIYKDNADIKMGDTYQYPNTSDAYERPPFAVRVSSRLAEINEFGLVGIHTKPTSAVEEINNLTLVVPVVKKALGVDNVIVMGDFNADCGYANNAEKENFLLRTDKSYKWLIDDDEDTTVGSTGCAYDRIVVTGDKLTKLVPADASIYVFDNDFSFDDEVEPIDISDHYVVQLHIKDTGEFWNKIEKTRILDMEKKVKQLTNRLNAIANELAEVLPATSE